jgi:type IV pilus assembly protein PilQ
VTFYEALDSVLRVNGFGYIEEGNFIYIYTLAELAEIERANRRTESRIFELEHLSAVDAREFVEPLLSPDGKISARGEVQQGFRPDLQNGGADDYAFTAKVVVNDYPDNINAIAALLAELDTPPQQVLVEATILQTALNEDNAFGIDFSLIADVNFNIFNNPLSVVEDLLSGSGRDKTVIPQTDDDGNIPVTRRLTEIPFVKPPQQPWPGQSTVGNTPGPGGLKVGVVRDDFSRLPAPAR